MGRASRAKEERRSARRDRPRLIKKVADQVSLLAVLGASFDSGHRVTGYPMATVVRVLVHDTTASHALLAQLGDLNGMPYLDTSLPLDPANMLPHNGLVLMKMTTGVGAEWVPRCEVDSAPPGAEPRHTTFDDWWNKPVIKDRDAVLWSRRRIILTVANKEGGAHIDPDQPLDYRSLEEENSMGWTYHDPTTGDVPMAEGPLLPSIRQIAFELERSLEERHGDELAGST